VKFDWRVTKLKHEDYDIAVHYPHERGLTTGFSIITAFLAKNVTVCYQVCSRVYIKSLGNLYIKEISQLSTSQNKCMLLFQFLDQVSASIYSQQLFRPVSRQIVVSRPMELKKRGKGIDDNLIRLVYVFCLIFKVQCTSSILKNEGTSIN
jgi:hypothetical protein